jgi:hypothetical protein
VVGVLQLDVLKSRVAGEYGAPIELEAIPYQTARWVTGAPAAVDAFKAEKPLQPGGRPRRPPGLPGPQQLGTRQHGQALSRTWLSATPAS